MLTKPIRRVFVALLLSYLAQSVFACPATPTFITTLGHAEERFGVSYPDQILALALPAKSIDSACLLVMQSASATPGSGDKIPSQILSGNRIAVRTDLPANVNRYWHLYAGNPVANVANSVQVIDGSDQVTLTNGLIAVRLASRMPDPKKALGPIQGVRLRDGTWVGLGPNPLYYTPISAPIFFEAADFQVRYVDRGPLVTKVALDYRLRSAAVMAGTVERAPAQDGFYHVTVEQQAGQPSLLITDNANVTLAYALGLQPTTQLNQARFRGFITLASSYGQDSDHHLINAQTSQGFRDAFLDLEPFHVFGMAAKVYPRMRFWDPWAQNAGWYYQLYDKAAPTGANVMGFFAGPASQLLGVTNSGPGIYTDATITGLSLQINRRSPDTRFFDEVRFAWGFYVGTKDARFADSKTIQSIGLQMNLHGGIGLAQLVALDPPAAQASGDGSHVYVDAKTASDMAQRLCHDAQAYKDVAVQLTPVAQNDLKIWCDNLSVADVITQVKAFTSTMMNALVNGDGLYGAQYQYWHGGFVMVGHAQLMNSFLAQGKGSESQREWMRTTIALYNALLHNLDFVPMRDDYFSAPNTLGLNFGPGNMAVMYKSYRDFFSLLTIQLSAKASRPSALSAVEAIFAPMRNTVSNILNESGAEMGSSHYLRASIEPVLNELMQIKASGLVNPFSDPVITQRLSRFGPFMLNFLTPPEVRFGGARKNPAIGDATTAGEPVYGELGTLFAGQDDALSRQLLWAWKASGKLRSGVNANSVFLINDQLDTQDPHLGNATFPGWYSVERHGWETVNETALWFVNGNFYSDHAHWDRGNVVLYALGAPLSLDWSSFYQPETAGAWMHSVVVADPVMVQNWRQEQAPLTDDQITQALPTYLNKAPAKPTAGDVLFMSFLNSSHVQTPFEYHDGSRWTRAVTTVHVDASHPIIVIRDTFAGPFANADKISSFNLMAEGTVDTPTGAYTPPPRLYDFKLGHIPRETPSIGPAMTFKKGLTRLGFKGQWLIDWDLYELTTEPTEAFIGNWAHNSHDDLTDASGFAKANGGKPYEERQHILRIKGKGPFLKVILPYRKGETRNAVVTQQGESVVISDGNKVTTIAPTFSSYSDGSQSVLTSLSDAPADALGMHVEGGPVEIVKTPTAYTLTAHGQKGQRRMKLPDTWIAPAPLVYSEGMYVWDYKGTEAQSITLINLVPSVELANLQVYPNPWRSDRHPLKVVHFAPAPKETTVKIFEITGRWIRTLRAPGNEITWDLNDDRATPVASGLYIYLASDSAGHKKRGKLAIIR